MVTSIARLDGDTSGTRLAQVLDVETILRRMVPAEGKEVDPDAIPHVLLKQGSFILAADDSVVARNLIEQGLQAMHAPFVMTKSGKEAWDKLNSIAEGCKAEGIDVIDRVALVLTDLEMPEMDGFTLTRKIKQDPRFSKIPVVIHSSLSGKTNEDHVKGVGADAYVAKFVAEDLASTIKQVLHK
jgi:two-component system chemotaxis response regulator CheV